jgi:hypothetical protein
MQEVVLLQVEQKSIHDKQVESEDKKYPDLHEVHAFSELQALHVELQLKHWLFEM